MVEVKDRKKNVSSEFMVHDPSLAFDREKLVSGCYTDRLSFFLKY